MDLQGEGEGQGQAMMPLDMKILTAQVEELKQKLRVNGQALDKMQSPEESQLPAFASMPKSQITDASSDELILKVRFMTQQFKIDKQEYQQKGFHFDVDERVIEIRKLFDLTLAQLRDCYDLNIKLESRQWDALKKLMVDS